jgi:hypothetical protein
MTIMNLDLQPDQVDPPADDAHFTAFPKNRGALDYITKADRAYIAHDLPRPVVRDIFGSGVDPAAEARIDWEGIAIGAFLAGYLILVSAVLLKVAAFADAFVS